MESLKSLRFALAWLLPLSVGWAAWHSPWLAWAGVAAFQLGMALLEQVPALRHSPPATSATAWHRACIRLHVPLQWALLALGVTVAAREGSGAWAVVALGIGVGGVTGSQGITFAHELGHARSRVDRGLAWLLMMSVNYSHFMVEHYRGHHPRAATFEDPASARRGESLWRFLPRTLAGSWHSAWALEQRQLAQRRRPWPRSPLLWATLAQAAWLLVLGWGGGAMVLLFWVAQSAYAVFLLEAINYIEHYGLERRAVDGRREPFGAQHAWSADHLLTNCFIANLQRHSDHHLHAWKPYPELELLSGPQLPAGYAGCLFLAAVPPLWFRSMHPRLPAAERACCR